MVAGARAAVLISAGAGAEQLVLPAAARGESAPALVQAALGQAPLLGGEPRDGWPADLELRAGGWLLTVRDLRAICESVAAAQRQLVGLSSFNPHTLVAAKSLGFAAWRARAVPAGQAKELEGPELTLHQGTLRSGDHLQVSGSVLLLGDVNPGARITADGHVLVWGKLRGVAHAGASGDESARILALQLRPLQLRIAAAVARGPEGLPPEGLAEEARLVQGAIQIDPASPSWPLSA